MIKVGVGLLDRETGEMRYFAEGREDSIAVTVIGNDGSYYTAGSPTRRAIGKAFFASLDPLLGGITRYAPKRLDLLARDALCAAKHRLNKEVVTPDDRLQADILLAQALKTGEIVDIDGVC